MHITLWLMIVSLFAVREGEPALSTIYETAGDDNGLPIAYTSSSTLPVPISQLSRVRFFSETAAMFDAVCGRISKPCTMVVYFNGPPMIQPRDWITFTSLYGLPEIILHAKIDRSVITALGPVPENSDDDSLSFIALNVRCNAVINGRDGIHLASVRLIVSGLHGAGFITGGGFEILNLFCVASRVRIPIVKFVDWSHVRRWSDETEVAAEIWMLDFIARQY